MRHLYTFLVCLFVYTAAFSQQAIRFTTGSDDFTESTYRFELPDFQFHGPENAKTIHIPGAHPLLVKGAPDLPSFTTSFIVPNLSGFTYELINPVYEEMTNLNVAPSLGNVSRQINPATLEPSYLPSFLVSEFWPASNVSLENPFILRDFKGAVLRINPFRYNSITHTLQILRSADIRIMCELSSSEQNSPNAISAGIQAVYKRHFSNFPVGRYSPVDEQGTMLILCHAPFMAAMQDFVDWKRKRGMKVWMLDVSEAGQTPESIKQFVHSFYTTHNIQFLLLVGDIAQIPSPTKSGGKSDPSYGYLLGDDEYPELMVGRFSAESIQDVQTQVKRSIDYERMTPEQGEYLSALAGIASQEGPGDNDELDFEHLRLIRDVLLDFTYETPYEFYEGSQGEFDADGYPNPGQVTQMLDSGVGIINYTGHGSSFSWATSEFSNNDILNLNNVGKLPFIWSVACVNGEFDNGTCFAEVWLRATRQNEPIGAVGAMMSSINQSWNPPMCAQDEMVNILTESNADVIRRTYGSISMNGCLKMNEVYGDAGVEMTDTWHLFGDPSLLLRTKQPEALSVNHVSTVSIGTSFISVNCNTENAFVSITQMGQLLGTGLVSAGTANIQTTPITSPEALDVVVTAFNKSPYEGQINLIPSEEPFIVLEALNVAATVNAEVNFLHQNGEFDMILHLRNFGLTPSSAIEANLSTNLPWINISNATCFSASIDAESFANPLNCFQFTINEGVANQSSALFQLLITDQEDRTWEFPIQLPVRAPRLSITGYSINDQNAHTPNNRFDAGETVQLNIPLTNVGSFEAIAGSITLSTASPFATVVQNQMQTNLLASGNQLEASFTIAIAAEAPVNTPVLFNVEALSGSYIGTFSFTERIGAIIEDAESGDFDSFNWLSSNVFPWITDESQAFEGTHSFRSGNISDNQSSLLQLEFTVTEADTIRFARKVSSEDGYDFLRFRINQQQLGEWAGERDWEIVKFPVNPGQHMFSWEYQKDEIVSSGWDAAWIDLIQFPVGFETNPIDPTRVSIPSTPTLKVFPNPASGHIYVTLGAYLPANTELALFDISGRELSSTLIGSVNQEMIKIDVSTLTSGMYTLVLKSSEGLFTSKVVIE